MRERMIVLLVWVTIWDQTVSWAPPLRRWNQRLTKSLEFVPGEPLVTLHLMSIIRRLKIPQIQDSANRKGLSFPSMHTQCGSYLYHRFQTGVGKSSLINHAFGVKEAVSHLYWPFVLLTRFRRVCPAWNPAKPISMPKLCQAITVNSSCTTVKALNLGILTTSKQSENSLRAEIGCLTWGTSCMLFGIIYSS